MYAHDKDKLISCVRCAGCSDCCACDCIKFYQDYIEKSCKKCQRTQEMIFDHCQARLLAEQDKDRALLDLHKTLCSFALLEAEKTYAISQKEAQISNLRASLMRAEGLEFDAMTSLAEMQRRVIELEAEIKSAESRKYAQISDLFRGIELAELKRDNALAALKEVQEKFAELEKENRRIASHNQALVSNMSKTLKEAELARVDTHIALSKMQGEIAGLKAENQEMKSKNIVCLEEFRSSGFQIAAQLLMQAGRSSATEPSMSRKSCPLKPDVLDQCPMETLSMKSILGSFATYVAKAFQTTRVKHRKELDSAEFCPAPDYEIAGVDIVMNSDIADRFRHYVQQARVREPSWDHCHAAHRVVSPPESMRLLHMSLSGSDNVWDETILLGWHGASDESVAKILSDGFNPCCVGGGAGTLFGKGFYFAENSSKADLYAGPQDRRFKRHEGNKTVLLCAVFCGNMYQAKKACRDWTKPPTPADAQVQDSGIKRFLPFPDFIYCWLPFFDKSHLAI